MPNFKAEVLQGTLDLLELKTIDSMGPMHGFEIAMRIQQISEYLLRSNQGTLYPACCALSSAAGSSPSGVFRKITARPSITP